MQRMLNGVIGVIVVLLAAACNSQPAPDAAQMPGMTQAPASASEATGGLDIAFTATPQPLSTGENTFDVVVKQPDGTPVSDAAVSVEFFMAGMPSMTEMRNATPLTPQGDGRYSGKGLVLMAGNWDVTVMVTRAGQTLGSRKLSVAAAR